MNRYMKTLSEWPFVTRNYLRRGGTVEAAFLMCVGLAIGQDASIGDGQLEEVMEQEVGMLESAYSLLWADDNPCVGFTFTC
jgi:hypothetical protein